MEKKKRWSIKHVQHKPLQFQITDVCVLTHGSFQLLASVDMHDPPPAYHSFVQRGDRQAERTASFQLLTCGLISKCLSVVMLTCCDVMETNCMNRICNRKKTRSFSVISSCPQQEVLVWQSWVISAGVHPSRVWKKKGDRHWRRLICRICAPKFQWGSGWIQ